MLATRLRAVEHLAPGRPSVGAVTTTAPPVRLTQYAHGGGCACTIPPGELEAVVAGLTARGPSEPAAELVVGLDDEVFDLVWAVAASSSTIEDIAHRLEQMHARPS